MDYIDQEDIYNHSDVILRVVFSHLLFHDGTRSKCPVEFAFPK